MKKVAVQIVTYNSEDVLEKCLESIHSQSYPITQVVVVDNKSFDNTLNIIKSHRDYLNITIVENEDNIGFASGHNRALGFNNGEFVLVLNPDVELHNDYVLHLIEYYNKNPKAGSATGKLYRNKASKILDSTGLVIKKNRRAFDRGSGKFDNHKYDSLTDVFGVSGAAAMYRREMIEDISLEGEFFDETFFAYKEDVDVAWRAQLLGWKAGFVANAVAFHERGWKGSKYRSLIPLKIRKHSYINRYYLIIKNDSLFWFLLHLPFILLYELFSTGYAIIKEKNLFLAWRDFGVNYTKMVKKRKLIKSKQRVHDVIVYRFFKGIW